MHYVNELAILHTLISKVFLMKHWKAGSDLETRPVKCIGARLAKHGMKCVGSIGELWMCQTMLCKCFVVKSHKLVNPWVLGGGMGVDLWFKEVASVMGDLVEYPNSYPRYWGITLTSAWSWYSYLIISVTGHITHMYVELHGQLGGNACALTLVSEWCPTTIQKW